MDVATINQRKRVAHPSLAQTGKILDLVLTLRQNTPLPQPVGFMPTVLCIDDDLKAMSVRKQVLETEGYEVLTASDGSTGIEMAREHSVDAVVLDYSMGGMMGDATAEILKGEHPDLPIVLLTAYGLDVPGSLLRRVDRYVQKGEPAVRLLTAIGQVLRNEKQRPIKGIPPKEERKAG